MQRRARRNHSRRPGQSLDCGSISTAGLGSTVITHPFTAALAAAAAVSLQPVVVSAQTYSLTAVGVLTTLTATGSFAADGFADGDPYVFTDTFSDGCSVGTFGQSSLVYGCGRNTITARIDGHTFTQSFGPPDQPFPQQYAALGLSAATSPSPTVYDMGAN